MANENLPYSNQRQYESPPSVFCLTNVAFPGAMSPHYSVPRVFLPADFAYVLLCVTTVVLRCQSLCSGIHSRLFIDRRQTPSR